MAAESFLELKPSWPSTLEYKWLLHFGRRHARLPGFASQHQGDCKPLPNCLVPSSALEESSFKQPLMAASLEWFLPRDFPAFTSITCFQWLVTHPQVTDKVTDKPKVQPTKTIRPDQKLSALSKETNTQCPELCLWAKDSLVAVYAGEALLYGPDLDSERKLSLHKSLQQKRNGKYLVSAEYNEVNRNEEL
ncbi:hypothetical protein H920_17492 [Fukomys damarensis]|uniref:Uncharacterized protein n=1 Tax=Fukomys damarensis TaxID=885580 RepID=A0A091CPW7_FUKDA|nr:hypothetical protein H920_17492 [Fukomys damarensis]